MSINQCQSASQYLSVSHLLRQCLSISVNQSLSVRGFPGSPVVKTSPSKAESTGLIPGQGAKIPYLVSWPKSQNIKKQKQYWNKFNKNFKKWPTSKNKKLTRTINVSQSTSQCLSVSQPVNKDSTQLASEHHACLPLFTQHLSCF